MKTTQANGGMAVTPARETVTHNEEHVFNHDVHIAGSLYAKHIHGPNCGWFLTAEALNQIYPNPDPGHWAYVGPTLPATIYRCDEAGIWIATDETGGVDSDVDRVQRIETKLDNTAAELATVQEKLENKLEKLVVFPVEGITPLQRPVSAESTADPNSLIVYSTYNKCVCAMTQDMQLVRNWHFPEEKVVNDVTIPNGEVYHSVKKYAQLLYHLVPGQQAQTMNEGSTPGNAMFAIPLPKVTQDKLLYPMPDGNLQEFITSSLVRGLLTRMSNAEKRIGTLEGK